MPYYNIIPFRPVLAAGRGAGAGGRWSFAGGVAGYWYGGQPCRQSVGGVGGVASRSAVTGRQSVASRRQCRPSVGPLAVVGRPVGQPCRVRHKYVRTGGGPAPRKRAAVAGGGVPPHANTSLRCLIAKFFIFLFFLKNREASLTSLRERLAKTKPMI